MGIDNVNLFIASGQSDKEIEDGIDNCFVMLKANNIVGFAIIHDSMLHLIMVDTEYQNKGYGAELLTYIENEIFKKHSQITLQSFEKNEPTNQFYLKNGWHIKGKQIIDDLNINTLIFEKTK